MEKSSSLRVVDVHNIHRLIGESRDLGADSVAWRSHLFGGLCRLLGGTFAVGGETVGLLSGTHAPTTMVFWNAGVDERKVGNLFAYIQAETESGGTHPMLPHLHDLAAIQHVTIQRRDWVPDEEWYRSLVFQFQGDAGLDHNIASVHILQPKPADLHSAFMILREKGQRPFSGREVLLLNTLHRELAPLIGRQLAGGNEPSPAGLAPRHRKVLEALLDGDSEKQIARRLGYSQSTVHEYIKAIYRHFRVESRAELMARWIRFDRSAPGGNPAS